MKDLNYLFKKDKNDLITLLLELDEESVPMSFDEKFDLIIELQPMSVDYLVGEIAVMLNCCPSIGSIIFYLNKRYSDKKVLK
jgi:hypothetical protein